MSFLKVVRNEADARAALRGFVLGVFLFTGVAYAAHCFPVQPARASGEYGAETVRAINANTTELKHIRSALERMEAGCK